MITIAGKVEPVRVYELISLAGQLEPPRVELRKTFAEGLAAYRSQDWDGALAHFEECLRIMPDDGPTRVLLDGVGVLRASAPGLDWGWRVASHQKVGEASDDPPIRQGRQVG